MCALCTEVYGQTQLTHKEITQNDFINQIEKRRRATIKDVSFILRLIEPSHALCTFSNIVRAIKLSRFICLFNWAICSFSDCPCTWRSRLRYFNKSGRKKWGLRTMPAKENARDKLYKQIGNLLKILLGKSTMEFAYFSCVPFKQSSIVLFTDEQIIDVLFSILCLWYFR